eukprot:CAMPEP_0174707664 /NCGR_PEP_ID=MMETSP1094-20130205/10121_1 /TAXON_ID=156173 /ORGANISM="Chrysochromulina brevifilum, Strain UTEX LB 985" /LENGTH=56 /DNA_ID=CAMNT_0015906079 /DNA_START=1052 /DNA_END=1222 /DNA_ORIENTATION=+
MPMFFRRSHALSGGWHALSECGIGLLYLLILPSMGTFCCSAVLAPLSGKLFWLRGE